MSNYLFSSYPYNGVASLNHPFFGAEAKQFADLMGKTEYKNWHFGFKHILCPRGVRLNLNHYCHICQGSAYWFNHLTEYHNGSAVSITKFKSFKWGMCNHKFIRIISMNNQIISALRVLNGEIEGFLRVTV